LVASETPQARSEDEEEAVTIRGESQSQTKHSAACAATRPWWSRGATMLDPTNPQTQYSFAFLTLFKVLLLNEGYVDRLKAHYALFKAKREWTRSSTPNRPKLGVKKKRKSPR
jgi:hypothetical protein